MIYLLLVLLLGCTKVVNTTEGPIEIPNDVSLYLSSSKELKSYETYKERSCTKCGFCYSFIQGKFTLSCFCSGSKLNKEHITEYEEIYKFRYNGKEHTTSPRIVESSKVLESGVCK